MNKFNLFFSAAALLLLAGVTQAQVFMVVTAGESPTSTPYDNLETAVQNAEAGSTVYIPTGEHVIAGSPEIAGSPRATTLLIDKPLNLIGAGSGEGTQHNSVIRGHVAVTADAGGSVFEGISIFITTSNGNLYLDGLSNFLLKRCIVGGNVYLSGKGDGNIFRECQFYYIQGTVSFYGSAGFNTDVSVYTKVMMQNCVLTYGIYSLRGAVLSNNVIADNSAPFAYVQNSLIANNIFTYNGNIATNYNYTTGNTWSYNLFVGDFNTTADNSYDHNITGEAIADVFETSPPSDGKYRLKEGGPATAAGSDGTDLGIYGSMAPAREQRIPSVPSVTEFIVSGVSAPDGKLPVKITVEVQE